MLQSTLNDNTVGERTVALKIIARCSSETLTTLLIKAGHKTDFTHAILKYDCKFMSWIVM